MEFGVCCSVSKVDDVAAAEPAFLEENVQAFLAPEQGDDEFAARRELALRSPVPVRAANCFLPGALKCVGPEVDETRLIRYAGSAFARAEAVGIETIVFGSGGARKVPDGFSRDRAEAQLVDILRKLGPLAEPHGVTIVVEPLNRSECNFINSLAEGAEAVKAASHPNVRLLADIYHMLRDGEPAGEIRRHGELIRHTHVAENKDRARPGAGGEDFRPYFRALLDAGFDGRMAVECRWGDIRAESPGALRYLKDQLAAAAG